ncbi:MAG: hypothetical protein KGI38_07305 [Thaumarchaeota archaeon]|nr:hypothetical protein [Nitrososphaerota archaeon]
MTRQGLPSLKGLAVLFVAIAIFWVPFAYYYVIPSTAANPASTTGSGQSSSTFQLTLAEIMNEPWGSNMVQPRFFVMGPNGMTPADNIILPVNTRIQLTIISYDTPTTGSTDQMGKVSGTVGGNVYMINGTSASGTDMMAKWGQNVTAVPGAMLAHTFTMPQLGISIPVVGGDTEVAYLYLTQTGTYSWFCQTPCGSGPMGMMGAMSTSGWMTGQVTVR